MAPLETRVAHPMFGLRPYLENPMLRTLVAALGVIALSSTAPWAQDGSQTSSGEEAATPAADAPQPAETITAAMLQNATVVSLEGQYDEDVWQDKAPLSAMIADLTEVGHIQDIVLSVEGQVEGVTVDVGGFLGLGTKSVLIPLEDVRLTRPDPDSDEITVVTRLNQQQLEDLPEYEVED